MPRIGPYTLHTIETGRFALDGGAMFGIVPRVLWERQMRPDERNRISMAMRCLLLESSDRLVLIDNGLGNKYDAKFQQLYAIDDETWNLHRSLQAAGFGAADVTDVILTHLHFDHAGGSVSREGEHLVMTFPNARHYVQRRHWEWAIAPRLREAASFLKENLDPLAASGQMVLLDGPGPVLPGIDVQVVDGHTEAQQIVQISGPEGTLVYVADLLPTHAHLPALWGMAYDIRPLQTIEEKQAFLAQAEAEGWTLFFGHDPSVALANVARTERGFAARDPRTLHEF